MTYLKYFLKFCILIGLIAVITTQLTSCKEECLGCPDELPWSHRDGQTCYETEDECKRMEGNIDECQKCK